MTAHSVCSHALFSSVMVGLCFCGAVLEWGCEARIGG